MSREPLYVTTPTHVVALWSYLTSAIVGLTFSIGLLDLESWLLLLHWPALVRLVCILWFLSATTALVASLAASKVRGNNAARRISWWLRLEAIADAGISVCILLFIAAIWINRGPEAATVTLMLLLGKFAGPAHRIRQIHRERPLLDRAAENPETAEVLAEPPADES